TDINIIALARRIGLSIQELDLLTLQDFFDLVYAYVGDDPDAPREATQEDIDALYRGRRQRAEPIKRVNVVIGTEPTGMAKALSDVDKRAKSIQSELKQVERLLKLDPKNTELLAQKQKLLSDAIATTRERLERLRSVQEQVNEQFQRGEISEA